MRSVALDRAASSEIDPVAELRDRILRADRRDHVRALAPHRHAERRVDRVAAGHAPHGRAVGEDEIVDADIANREEPGAAHVRIPRG